jgi:HEAT repeat protein
MFTDKSPDVRRGAAYQLLPFAASSDDLAQGYADLLDDEDATVRGIALGAMGQMKLNQRAVGAEQIAAVLARTSDDEQQRATAARLLSDLGKLAVPMLPELTKAASQDASAKVRSASLLAISRIAQPAEAVEILVKSLDDQDAAVRLVAVQRLRELGRDAAPAAEALGKLLESKDEKVRKTAAEALVRIGSPSLPLLTAALESKSRDTREVAALALGKMGAVAKPALSALRKLLKDSDAKVKQQAQLAILEIESM